MVLTAEELRLDTVHCFQLGENPTLALPGATLAAEGEREGGRDEGGGREGGRREGGREGGKEGGEGTGQYNMYKLLWCYTVS